MRIGVLSDTHGYLDDRVYHHFENCDEIWHAGDIGSMDILEKLRNFKPLKAVFGNIDDPLIRLECPEELFFVMEGLKIFIIHIGGTPGRYVKGLSKKLCALKPDLFICGHSHILKIMRDPKHNNLLFLNPGAAGIQGFHKIRTLVRFDIIKSTITNLQVIELGKRSSIK